MFVPINSLCTSLLRAFCWIIRRKYDYFAYINQRKYWTNHENARYIEVIDVTFSKLENRINRGELNIFPNFFRFFRRSTDPIDYYSDCCSTIRETREIRLNES